MENESIYYGTETRYHIEGAWYPRTPLLYIENVDQFYDHGSDIAKFCILDSSYGRLSGCIG